MQFYIEPMLKEREVAYFHFIYIHFWVLVDWVWLYCIPIVMYNYRIQCICCEVDVFSVPVDGVEQKPVMVVEVYCEPSWLEEWWFTN